MLSHLKHNKQQNSLLQHVPQEDPHADASQSGASLPSLPVEILEMIATEVDNDGLKSIRATCRALCNGSTKEFDQRHTYSEVEIIVTHDHPNMRKLIVTLRSPDLVKTQAVMAELLALHDPLYVEDDSKGTIRASHAITSNPDAFTLQQVKNYRQWHGYALAPLIFERIADLPPQATRLRRLVIENALLEGNALIEILETHKHHLRHATLRKVIITDVVGCARALCRTETRRLEVEDLKIGERVGKEVYFTYFTRRHGAFLGFIETMKDWEALSRVGRPTSTWVRKRETN